MRAAIVLRICETASVRGAPLVPANPNVRRLMLAALGVLGATILSGIGAVHIWPVARETLKFVEYIVMFWCAASLVIAEAVRLLHHGPAYLDIKLGLGNPSWRLTRRNGNYTAQDGALSSVRANQRWTAKN